MSSLCKAFHPHIGAHCSNFHLSLLPSKPHLSYTQTACVLVMPIGNQVQCRYSYLACAHCLGASSWPVCTVRWWPCAPTIYTKGLLNQDVTPHFQNLILKCIYRNSQVAWILRSKWHLSPMSDGDKFVSCNLKGRFEEACPSCPSYSVLVLSLLCRDNDMQLCWIWPF